MNAAIRPLLAALLIGAAATAPAAAPAPPPGDQPAPKSEAKDYQLSLDQMRTFTEVFARIKQDYVEDVDDATLMRAAIRGMLDGLDPHTAYLDDSEFQALEEDTTGRFNGIGIEVVRANGDLRVVSPIDGTPADQAGVKPGDIITAIDGKSAEGMDLQDAVDLIRGEPGTSVTLELLRDPSKEPLKVELKRAVVHVNSVRSRLLEEHYGYVRITAFQNDTPASTREALQDLVKKSDGELRGVVLDLRNNPGGVLNAAVGVADLFLHDGLIVYTEGRSDESELSFSADTDELIPATPVVVLINGGTASASEIVAGALQDHHRALLVGEPSFGKGSVQTILPLTNGSAVKLTTALYYTPSGRSIQALGIHPDITVAERSPEQPAPESSAPRREADLAGHLEVVQKPEQAKQSDGDRLAARDFQLYQALNLLKGASILGQAGTPSG